MGDHKFVDGVCRRCDRSELVTTHSDAMPRIRDARRLHDGTAEGEPDALEDMIKGEEPVPPR